MTKRAPVSPTNYAPFEPLKFTDSKEFEERLAYVKALSCEEGNLVKRSVQVFICLEQRGEAGVEENVSSTGDVESSTYIRFYTLQK